MGKRILCTFSGARYHNTTRRIVEDSMKFGATEPPCIFDDVWLKTKRPEHCAATKWAFDDPNVRGVNWFCFKIETIMSALKRCDDGDCVLFIDADTWPISDMTPLFEMCERSQIVLFAACNHSQRFWAKRDLMAAMDMDHPFWRDRQAAVARFMLLKKGGRIQYAPEERAAGKWISVNDFLEEWTLYTNNPKTNTFERSADEYGDLIEHRCEQSVLTNLAHKYNIPLHREADQWGNDFKADFPNDTYGQIFESTGVYSYDPNGNRDGSSFRNVND